MPKFCDHGKNYDSFIRIFQRHKNLKILQKLADQVIELYHNSPGFFIKLF